MKWLEGQTGVAILLLSLVAGYFLFLRKDKGGATLPKASYKAELTTAPTTSIITSPTPDPNTQAQENSRRAYNMLLAHGITRVPAEVKGNHIRVSIQAKAEPQWCRTGDFDLIKSLAGSPTEKLLTLSLEPIGKDTKRKTEKLSVSDIAAGKVVNLTLPLADGAYGLYLCTDQGGTGQCSRKEAIDPKIWTADGATRKKLANNRIFYFQLIYVKAGSVHIVPSGNWGKEHLNKLHDRFEDWMGRDVDALKKMGTLISRLKPLPARLTSNRIEIPLPYNDLRCVSH